MTTPPPVDSRGDGRTVERQRVRRVQAWRPYAAVGFISLALLFILPEVALRIFRERRIDGDVMAIASVVGFVGFYLMDPKDTTSAGTWLVDAGIRIVNTVRPGKRSTDPEGTTVVETKVIPPSGPPAQ